MKNSWILLIVLNCWLVGQHVAAAEGVYRVGVANFQGSLTMAAQLNPILDWVGKRAGVSLEMKTGVNFEDMNRRLLRGEYDFYIGYPALQSKMRHLFHMRVLAKLQGETTSAIVVQGDSAYQQLSDLAGQEVVIGNQGVFIANVLPSAALLERGIHVLKRFIGNQESLVTEFKLHRFQAIAVNLVLFERLMQDSPPGAYRVLWRSPAVMNYPLTVQSHVAPDVAERVQQAFIAMRDDPEGRRILAQVNALPGLQWTGWEQATDQDFGVAMMSYDQLDNRGDR